MGGSTKERSSFSMSDFARVATPAVDHFPAGEWRQLVARVLGEAVERGEVAADLDPMSVGEQLMCLVDGVLMQATLEPLRLPAERQVQFLDAALAWLTPPSG